MMLLTVRDPPDQREFAPGSHSTIVRLPVRPKLADGTGYSRWTTEAGFGQSHRHIFDGSGAGLDDTCAAVRFPRGFRHVSERESSPTEKPRDDNPAFARLSVMCGLRIHHLPRYEL